MIFIKRPDSPEIFTRKNSPALKERQRAEIHFTKIPPDPEPFKFKFFSVYKEDYKGILINTFHSRCAYCECLVTVGARGDIEHFRPKGEYVTRDRETKTPGYYWLASDWSNLYLSCTNCNQNGTFKILDASNPTIVIEKTAGKMNQFALVDENFRRDRHTMPLAEEEPYRLLIDPCKDKPEEYLEFLSSGVVRARGTGARQDEMAQYSIDVFVLQRDELVTLRQAKYIEAMGLIKQVDETSSVVIADLQGAITGIKEDLLKDTLNTTFAKMIDMLDVAKIKNEYIAVARQYIEPFLEIYCKRLSDLFNPINKNQPWYESAINYFKNQVFSLRQYLNK